jgi:hypothetical protein
MYLLYYALKCINCIHCDQAKCEISGSDGGEYEV